LQSSTNGSHPQPVPPIPSAAAATAPPKPSKLKSLVAQTIDLNKFGGCEYVYLDALVQETLENYDTAADTFQWQFFGDKMDHCIKHIEDKCANKRVFLVSTGSLGEQIVPKIHNLPQMYAIYIYCQDTKRHSQWGNKLSKVRVVCNNDDLFLLPQLVIEVARTYID